MSHVLRIWLAILRIADVEDIERSAYTMLFLGAYTPWCCLSKGSTKPKRECCTYKYSQCIFLDMVWKVNDSHCIFVWRLCCCYVCAFFCFSFNSRCLQRLFLCAKRILYASILFLASCVFFLLFSLSWNAVQTKTIIFSLLIFFFCLSL